MRRNLATSLRRRPRGDAMARYDRLPAELRHWLAGAALPWSPRSILRLWTRLRRETRDPAEIRRRLDLAEARMLARDAPKIWGAAYPGAVIRPAAPDAGRADAGDVSMDHAHPDPAADRLPRPRPSGAGASA